MLSSIFNPDGGGHDDVMHSYSFMLIYGELVLIGTPNNIIIARK